MKLLKLSEGEADRLWKALEGLLATGSLSEKISSLQEQHFDDLEEIVTTIDSLNQVKAHTDLPTDRFATEILDAIRVSGKDELRSAIAADEPKARVYLVRLLSIRSFAKAARAQVLEREHARLLHEVRILSDLRPIFDAEVTVDPVGFLVCHTLKIEYHEGSEFKEIFLALNKQDLADLSAVAKRAQEKDDALRALLSTKELKAFKLS